DTDGCKPGRMLALALHLLHDLAEMSDFAGAETPLQLVRGDDPHTVRRALLNDPEPARVIEQAAKRADRTARDSRPAGGLTATSGPAHPRRPSGGDIGLEALNIGQP